MIYMHKSHFIVDISNDIFIWGKNCEYISLYFAIYANIAFDTRWYLFYYKIIVQRSLIIRINACVGECRINIYSRYFIIDVAQSFDYRGSNSTAVWHSIRSVCK